MFDSGKMGGTTGAVHLVVSEMEDSASEAIWLPTSNGLFRRSESASHDHSNYKYAETRAHLRHIITAVDEADCSANRHFTWVCSSRCCDDLP